MTKIKEQDQKKKKQQKGAKKYKKSTKGVTNHLEPMGKNPKNIVKNG